MIAHSSASFHVNHLISHSAQSKKTIEGGWSFKSPGTKVTRNLTPQWRHGMSTTSSENVLQMNLAYGWICYQEPLNALTQFKHKPSAFLQLSLSETANTDLPNPKDFQQLLDEGTSNSDI
ncbi:replicase-associated protein [Striga asiatica]|uniref:Replicase-associated protein n=1 Tax=Striga asiatica TaxID=4170 RepID=A0A5A7PSB4_STRAF|nr:replicase-associated protein [Striga asiatica]